MRNYILLALILITTLSSAQQQITFDTEDYRGIGVYDSAPSSPLRQGKITGEAQIVDNPLVQTATTMGKVCNTTPRVVVLQRSRMGSNTYGLRIDLKEPIRMTKENQYIHFMALVPHKPAGSKMMVIGLGKRTEEAWSWQDGEDEQFWSLSTEVINASDEWQNVTCAFRGFSYSQQENPNSGIDIYSLIIIPDVRSAHADSYDWAAYIDQIVINQEP